MFSHKHSTPQSAGSKQIDPVRYFQFVTFNLEEMSNLYSFVKYLVPMLPRNGTSTLIESMNRCVRKKYRILHGIRTQKLLIISLLKTRYPPSDMTSLEKETTATFRALYCSTWENNSYLVNWWFAKKTWMKLRHQSNQTHRHDQSHFDEPNMICTLFQIIHGIVFLSVYTTTNTQMCSI